MNELYADIIVDISVQALDRPFSYRIPEVLKDSVSVGSLVTIPFGARMVRGYVIRLKDSCDYDPDKIRDIAAVLTDEETVEARLIALAGWMCRTYGGVMAQSLRTVLPLGKKVNPLTIRRASITDRNMAIYYKGRLGKRQQGRARVIDSLLMHDNQLVADLMREQNVSIEIIRGLEKDGIICIMTQENYRKVIEEAEALPPDVLTGEQSMAVRKIRTEWSTKNRPVLLKGITGSGKTLVYMELIADTLAEGKQVIMLIPEIALTRQTVTRFVKRFGEKVSFLHSRLSEGERYDQMKAAKRGDVSIMVGPRSALFTPFTKLGLIIIDEEHEETYRSEMTPRYHARETAEKRAEIEGAHLLLGSATPSITSAYRVWEGRYAGESLTQRYGSAMLPKTLIVDMREEAAKGNRSMFSEELSGRLRACLDRGEQAMLFLNRRGYAGFVTCRSCGFVAKCPHCDVSLTRHANGKLICHYCGYEIPEYMECPECKSRHIGGISVGTQQVEEALRKEFAGIRTLRMDFDSTRGKEGHGRILREFGRGDADVLVGTQMIVKGHDFPNVTLVGVLMADLSLNESDYRSQERTYQLITQAVGRAGRGTKPGTAVIQTYQPENSTLRYAAAQSYGPFYREEIAYRKIMRYPPVGGLLAILGSAASEELLTVGMGYIRKYIDIIDKRGALAAIGPAPQTVGKIRDRFRQVIYLRHKEIENLIRARHMIEEYIRINSGFEEIRIEFDINV